MSSYNPANTNDADALNPDRNRWLFGWTPQAEIWNGRFAMIGFLSAVLIELFSNQGFLHFWGFMTDHVGRTVS